MTKYWIAGLGVVAAAIACYAYARLRSPDSAARDDRPGRPAGVAPPSSAPMAGAPSKAPEKPAAMEAISRASEAGAHLFIFVHQGHGPETREIRDRFEAAIAKIGDSVRWTAVDRDNPSEKDIVAKFELGNAPIPIVLALAPNGAITGGLRPPEMTEEKIRNAIASPVLQKCLKSLQEGRLVLLCVRAKSIPPDDPSWQGVNEFREDERFKEYTDIVQVDPADSAEKKFLNSLEIDPRATAPTTVLFMPPGTVAANIAGPTTKEDFVRGLRPPSSGG